MTGLDSKLIAHCQAGYDYLWDRWGIFAGQIGQCCIVADFGIMVMRNRAGPWNVFFTLIVLAMLEVRNYMQRNKMYKALNASADSARNMWVFRSAITGIVWGLDIAVMGLLGVFSGALFAAFIYQYCLMFRDRDDSRFRQPKLSLQATS